MKPESLVNKPGVCTRRQATTQGAFQLTSTHNALLSGSHEGLWWHWIIFPNLHNNSPIRFKPLEGVILVFLSANSCTQILRPALRPHTGSRAAWYVEEPGVSFFPCEKRRESLSHANSPLCRQSHGSITSHSYLSLWRFLLMHSHTHTNTHPFFHSVDFHNLFLHNVILGNQLDGIFWNDVSSDESCRFICCSPFSYKGGEHRE